jgi:nondiscriminating aspartyl-tRNA synthetase
MERTLAKQAVNQVGEEILIKGSVAARRNMGKIVFIDLRDRSAVIQVVMVPSELDEASSSRLTELRPEFVLAVRGMVNKRGDKQINPDMTTGTVEVLAKSFEILAAAETLPYDLNTAELKTDTLLDLAPLNYRREDEKAIFRVQATLVASFREYLMSKDFTEFQCPKLVGAATEGGANFFELPYFGYKAFLAQSPQFYKQMMVGVFERVFTTGNVYRAEEHDTNRHTNEYTSLDFEMGYIESHHDVMQMTEGVVRHMMKKIEEKNGADLKAAQATMPTLPEKFPAMKLKEAQQILKDEFGEDCLNEPDLEPHQERMLGEYARRTLSSDFIFITHYPVSKRPMYTYEDEADPGFTKSFDLLFRGQEMVTGGQRVHDYELLKKKIAAKGLNPDDFEFYLAAFKYGMPPHGGIGLGLERVTMSLLGLETIKRATLLPRDQTRIDLPLSKLQPKSQGKQGKQGK